VSLESDLESELGANQKFHLAFAPNLEPNLQNIFQIIDHGCAGSNRFAGEGLPWQTPTDLERILNLHTSSH
jgi:hypothetical protein